MARHTLDDLRSEGTLDSEGSFTLDPEARDRKMGIDAKKERQLELQIGRKLWENGLDFCTLSGEKQRLVLRFRNLVSLQLGWRWGLLLGLLMLVSWNHLSPYISLDVVYIFGYPISRLWIDPVCMAGITALMIWILNTSWLLFLPIRMFNVFFFFTSCFICLIIDALYPHNSMYLLILGNTVVQAIITILILAYFLKENKMQSVVASIVDLVGGFLNNTVNKVKDFMSIQDVLDDISKE